MGDQATAVATQDEASEASIEERLSAKLDRFAGPDDPPQSQDDSGEVALEATDQASDEPTAEDIVDDDAEAQAKPQSDGEEFEVEWQGQKHKMDRAKLLEHAQKGFDYTVKTQQLAADRAQVQAQSQLLAQTAALQNQLIDDVANLKVVESELSRYPRTADQWNAIVNEDPVAALKVKTTYDALVQQRQAMMAQLQAKAAHLQAQQGTLSQAQLQAEMEKAKARVPRWVNQDEFAKDANAITKYGLKEGYTERELQSIQDSRHLTTLYKAMRYDQLVASKASKVGQVRSAPPMVKPGQGASAVPTKDQKTTSLLQKIKATNDPREKEALIAQRMRERF